MLLLKKFTWKKFQKTLFLPQLMFHDLLILITIFRCFFSKHLEKKGPCFSHQDRSERLKNADVGAVFVLSSCDKALMAVRLRPIRTAKEAYPHCDWGLLVMPFDM
ncbi:hypothetical protein HMPREF1870_02639 [Bacteroidales bacterium KA00344]|nr:hypothetical protein HMPREF1870_02639 [Bacteroidales bacterium KA00344]